MGNGPPMGIDRRLFSRLQFSEAGFAGFPYEPVRSENGCFA